MTADQTYTRTYSHARTHTKTSQRASRISALRAARLGAAICTSSQESCDLSPPIKKKKSAEAIPESCRGCSFSLNHSRVGGLASDTTEVKREASSSWGRAIMLRLPFELFNWIFVYLFIFFSPFTISQLPKNLVRRQN